MDDLDTDSVPRPRRQRPKDSFQHELQSKLKERKKKGLSADITDSDEDGFNTYQDYQAKSSKEKRPGSAKWRENHSPDLSSGLGTTTMRTKDLKKLLSYDNYDDDEDDEEVATTFAKTKSWQPSGSKTPSPKQESKFLKQNKQPTNGLDSIYGKKTPTNETLSKEDIIFGRKTPTEGKKSPNDWSQREKSWQPPNFRSASPSSTMDYNKGSRGVTPVDSILESISETPREKITPRLQRGQKIEISPRQSSLDGNKPVPQARSRDVNRISPNAIKDSDKFESSRDVTIRGSTTPTFDSDKKRTIPTYDSDKKRTTPTFDGDKKRTTPTFDSDKKRMSPTYESEKKRTIPTFESDKKRTTPTFDSDKKRMSPTYESEKKRTIPTFESDKKRTTPTFDSDKKRMSPTYESEKKRTIPTFESDKKRTTPTFESDKKRTTPTFDSDKSRSKFSNDFETDTRHKSSTNLFGSSRADSKHDLDAYISAEKGRKSEPKTPSTDRQRYNRSPSPEPKSGLRNKSKEKSTDKSTGSRVTFEGKKEQNISKTGQLGKKSFFEKSYDDEDELQSKPTPTLMDLVTDKPKAQARNGKLTSGGQNLKHDMNNGQKSPSISRKTPEMFRKSLSDHSFQGDSIQAEYKQQRSEDTSSLCEELPPDPNRKLAQENVGKDKSGTEREKNDLLIDSVAGAQTMTFIGQNPKRVRPVTANAKVQHRPKPRYGLLPGQTTTLNERQFNSTGDIRDAVYDEWYREHLKSAKERKKLEEKKKKEEEEKKRKDAEQKKLESESSYKSWMKAKTEALLTEKEKKEAEERKKKEKEEQEKEEKKIESVKSFESWKQKKETVIKKEQRKEAEKKRLQQEEEKRKLEEAKREKLNAHSSWEKRKKEQESKRQKETSSAKKSEEERRLEEKEALRKKEEEANEKYMQWLEEKEKKNRKEKTKPRQISEEDYKPAWFPASRTIPFGR